jgi:hypothetical protein
MFTLYYLHLCYSSIDHGATPGKCANMWTIMAVRDGHDGHETTTILIYKYELLYSSNVGGEWDQSTLQVAKAVR